MLMVRPRRALSPMNDVRHELDSMRAAGAWKVWEPLYHTRDWFRGYGFHIGLIAMIAIFGLTGYETTLLFADGRGFTAWDPSSPWDTNVPPLPWSIFVYLTLYLYSPLPIIFAERDLRGRRELTFLAQGMILLFLVSYGFFLLMPAEVVVRPQMEQLLPSMRPLVKDIFGVVYAIDRPWNSWPSLHVSQSLLIVLFVQRWLGIRSEEFPNHRPWLIALWVAWVALSLSILTTKQHFIWDMVSGAGLGALIWWYYILPKLEQRTESTRSAQLPTTA